MYCTLCGQVLIADRTSKEVSRVIEEVFAKSSAQSSLSNKANRICFAKQESFLAKDTDEWIQEVFLYTIISICISTAIPTDLTCDDPCDHFNS